MRTTRMRVEEACRVKFVDKGGAARPREDDAGSLDQRMQRDEGICD